MRFLNRRANAVAKDVWSERFGNWPNDRHVPLGFKQNFRSRDRRLRTRINLCADQIETSTSSPRANPGHLTIFCARGVGNLTDKAFPGVGNLTLPGWGGENWTGSVRFQICFFRAPKSLTAINTCLDEMEEFEGRDIAFVSDWLTKKGLQKWECLNINDFCRLYIKDVDFLYNESRCGFVPRLCLQRFLE